MGTLATVKAEVAYALVAEVQMAHRGFGKDRLGPSWEHTYVSGSEAGEGGVDPLLS